MKKHLFICILLLYATPFWAQKDSLRLLIKGFGKVNEFCKDGMNTGFRGDCYAAQYNALIRLADTTTLLKLLKNRKKMVVMYASLALIDKKYQNLSLVMNILIKKRISVSVAGCMTMYEPLYELFYRYFLDKMSKDMSLSDKKAYILSFHHIFEQNKGQKYFHYDDIVEYEQGVLNLIERNMEY